MKLVGIVLSLVIVLLLAFTLLNWAAFTTPSTLSVGLTTVQVPLGLVMLAVAGLLTAVFGIYLAYQQAAALVAARRAARDLEQQRKIAEEKEASRIADLRSYLEREIAKLGGASGDSTLLRIEQTILDRLNDVENALAAHMAEVEDKIDRVLGAAPRTPGAR